MLPPLKHLVGKQVLGPSSNVVRQVGCSELLGLNLPQLTSRCHKSVKGGYFCGGKWRTSANPSSRSWRRKKELYQHVDTISQISSIGRLNEHLVEEDGSRDVADKPVHISSAPSDGAASVCSSGGLLRHPTGALCPSLCWLTLIAHASAGLVYALILIECFL